MAQGDRSSTSGINQLRMNLEGRVAVVTGAAMGMGRELALGLSLLCVAHSFYRLELRTVYESSMPHG